MNEEQQQRHREKVRVSDDSSRMSPVVKDGQTTSLRACESVCIVFISVYVKMSIRECFPKSPNSTKSLTFFFRFSQLCSQQQQPTLQRKGMNEALNTSITSDHHA